MEKAKYHILWIIFWTHNWHPIARPCGRAMGRQLWAFWTKSTVLWQDSTVFYLITHLRRVKLQFGRVKNLVTIYKLCVTCPNILKKAIRTSAIKGLGRTLLYPNENEKGTDFEWASLKGCLEMNKANLRDLIAATGLWSGNAQSGSKSVMFCPVRPWNLMDDLGKQ